MKAALTKFGNSGKKLSDEQKEHALRQIMSKAVVSAEVIDIFKAAGLSRPDIGILSDEFLEDVRAMKERNLAVELLERLLRDDIKSRFKTNVVQQAKFSELLQLSLQRYRNRAIETAQVIEELIEMAKKFQEAAMRGEISDYKESLRQRVALLRGVPATALHQVYEQRLKLNPGARELVQACKAAGLKVLLVSGGFTFFADRVQQMLVLKTGAGQAQILGVALDRARLPEIVGTIAGDDTLLVIAPDARRATQLVKRLEQLAGEGGTT